MPEPTEAGDKPFDAGAKDTARAAKDGGSSGEPAGDGHQPSADAYKAMGLEPPKPTAPSQTPDGSKPPATPSPSAPSPAQAKADAEGQQVVDNFSGKIQSHSEELYANLAARARHEDGFIDSLIASKDPVDQKMAKKILERNSDHFGAKTPDEYLANKQIAEAGEDPVQQELARMRLKQSQTDRQLNDQQWAGWKSKVGIEEGSDIDKMVDSVRGEYPAGTPNADILHVARGRLGITTPLSPQKPGSSVPSGLPGGPAEPALPNADVMKLMRVDQKTVSRAEEYFKQFD